MGHQVTVHLGFPITSWVSLNLLRRPQPEAVAVGGARPVQDQGAREPLAPPPSCPTPLPQPSPVGRRGSTHPAGGGRDARPRPAGRRGQSAHHAERDRRLHRSRGPEWRGAGRRGRLSTGQSCAWRAWSFARCERNGGWWRSIRGCPGDVQQPGLPVRGLGERAGRPEVARSRVLPVQAHAGMGASCKGFCAARRGLCARGTEARQTAGLGQRVPPPFPIGAPAPHPEQGHTSLGAAVTGRTEAMHGPLSPAAGNSPSFESAKHPPGGELTMCWAPSSF